MAKKKEVERLLADLKRHGREISEITDAITGLLSGEAASETKAAPEEGATDKTYTFEDIRVLLVEKARAGGREEVKALLLKFGAKKLSEVAPADYDALASEAEAIGNG